MGHHFLNIYHLILKRAVLKNWQLFSKNLVFCRKYHKTNCSYFKNSSIHAALHCGQQGGR